MTLSGPNVVYSLGNPVDFSYPVLAQGGVGGMGLSKMAGWYGWSSTALKIGATYGDQSAGGIIDLGQNFTGTGVSLTGVTNRALGMISTTKTGYTALGLALTNNTGTTLNTINLSFVAELWRNNPAQQEVDFTYAIDPAGNASAFNPGTPNTPGTLALVSVPALNIDFPISATTSINNGLVSTNQLNLGTNLMTISDWAPGATLWLIWETQNPIGGAQAVAIDNVSFAASRVVPVVQPVLGGVSYSAASGLTFSFTNLPTASLSLTVHSTTNLTLPFSQWQNLGHPTEVSPGNYQVIDGGATNYKQRYYEVTAP